MTQRRMFSSIRSPLLIVFVILLVSGSFHANCREPFDPVNLTNLVHGAKVIYVIDESRCSSGVNYQEGGKWYVIDDAIVISKLEKELSAVSTKNRGGCPCGGQDVHYFAIKEDGEVERFGLDCGTFLEYVQIPENIQGMITPSNSDFIGREGGQTYIVDIPLEITEKEAEARFNQAGFLLMTGGYWNMFTPAHPREYVQRRAVLLTAPVHVTFNIGRFKYTYDKPWPPDDMPKPERDTWFNKLFQWEHEREKDAGEEADELLKNWIDNMGFDKNQIVSKSVGFSGSSSGGCKIEFGFNGELYFNNADEFQQVFESVHLEMDKIKIEKVEYRTEEQINSKFLYQAALLIPGKASPEELNQAKNVIPGIKRIVPICECSGTYGAKEE